MRVAPTLFFPLLLLAALLAGPEALAARGNHCQLRSDRHECTMQHQGLLEICKRIKKKKDEAREHARRACDRQERIARDMAACKSLANQAQMQACKARVDNEMKTDARKAAFEQDDLATEISKDSEDLRRMAEKLESSKEATSEEVQNARDNAKDGSEFSREVSDAATDNREAADKFGSNGEGERDAAKGLGPQAPSSGGGEDTPPQVAQAGSGAPASVPPTGGGNGQTAQPAAAPAVADNGSTISRALSDAQRLAAPRFVSEGAGNPQDARTSAVAPARTGALPGMPVAALVAVPVAAPGGLQVAAAPAAGGNVARSQSASFSESGSAPGSTGTDLRDRLKQSLASGGGSTAALAAEPVGSSASPTIASPVSVAAESASPVAYAAGLRARGEATAQEEALEPFTKPLGPPQITMAGSETDAAVSRLIRDTLDPPEELSADEGDGVGGRNGPTLFERAHQAHETSLRRGKVAGVAIR